MLLPDAAGPSIAIVIFFNSSLRILSNNIQNKTLESNEEFPLDYSTSAVLEVDGRAGFSQSAVGITRGKSRNSPVGISLNTAALLLQGISHHVCNTAKVYLSASHFRQFIENNKVFR